VFGYEVIETVHDGGPVGTLVNMAMNLQEFLNQLRDY
jgi:hypothetical protein